MVARSTVYLPLAGEWGAAGQEPVSAASAGNFVFTSGVPGIDAHTGRLAPDADSQCALAFDNLLAVLDRAGAGPDSIGLLSVFVPGRDRFAWFEERWGKLFPGPFRPARKIDHVPLPEGEAVQLMAACVLGETSVPIEVPGLCIDARIPLGARMGPVLFSSAVGAQDPMSGGRPDEVPAQIDRAFANMRLFMETAGGSSAGINHVWIFLEDFEFQPRMVDRWVADFPTFGDRPARKTLPYAFGDGTAIELQFTGYLGERRKNYEIAGVDHQDPIPMGSSIGPLLQSSGLYGIDAGTGRALAGLEPQLDAALANLDALLREAGATKDGVAHLTVMLQDFADAPAISVRLAAAFPDRDRSPALKFVRFRMDGQWRVQLHATAVIAP
jgi:2-iminobutanoate/2-iminopropanoate deaminase